MTPEEFRCIDITFLRNMGSYVNLRQHSHSSNIQLVMMECVKNRSFQDDFDLKFKGLQPNFKTVFS